MRKTVLCLMAGGALLVGACSGSDKSTGGTGGSVSTGGQGASGGSSGSTGGTSGATTGGSSGSTGGSGGAVATGGNSGATGAGGGTAGSGGSGGSGGTPPPPADAAPPADAGPAAPPAAGAPCPRCVKIFNGMNFDGWFASAATWKITPEGAMHGQGGTSRTAYTKDDYGNVRLIFTTRMNPVNGDHLGILFWGNRPTNPDKPEINNAGWLQWMPNFAGLWSYYPPKDKGVPAMRPNPNPGDWTKWHTCEMLLILDTGTVRVATDGIEVTRYMHPFPMERMDPTKRIIKGPIGMMKHGGGGSEYKDIWVEVDPTERDKFYTVK
jgi:hypothetical protein